MKTLFLIFHGRFPSEKAASLFTAKSSEAFADEGYMVTLLVPRRLGVDHSDPYGFYGIRKNFRIVYLPTLDLFGIPVLSRVAFYVSMTVFSFATLIYILMRSDRSSIIYSNEHLPLLLTSLVRKNTFYEIHDMPERNRSFYALLLRCIKGAIVTNHWKLEHIAKVFNISRTKLLYEPNAVEIAQFDIVTIKEEARAKLGIKSQTPIALYTGHLYGWKGVDTLARAAGILSGRAEVYVVGGTREDVVRFKKSFGHILNLHIVGHRPHSEISLWQKAADVVVLPNTARENISKYYTSPMKLFEYMASKRPIVATDIPSVREILDTTNAIIVPPDNPEAMARGIITAFENQSLVSRITDTAYRFVELHTWNKRAGRVLNFVEKRN
ncbi:MAG: glycosyltransferase family 4 protein [bacterium]|nr:glycosyltransferase family 4 protein [bacterium]